PGGGGGHPPLLVHAAARALARHEGRSDGELRGSRPPLVRICRRAAGGAEAAARDAAAYAERARRWRKACCAVTGPRRREDTKDARRSLSSCVPAASGHEGELDLTGDRFGQAEERRAERPRARRHAHVVVARRIEACR